MRAVKLIFDYFLGFLMPRVIGVGLFALAGAALGVVAWGVCTRRA
jgi:hypothetical protein